ncbi:DUF1499 domain-containing protein [Paenibacillus physcomitrellae]|uniref:DUF1499 domain-containing protein n=1 Tax=Paenibacillus physcomitrellae TaxID=1619311 RepID=A0ABQ1GIR4_9BACL|nr:DUF1499 domain-containing protein [Paenibacillus physcomitrellae]GGA44597.1 hypothetical protein GCM10010917_32380 [Paenibacillus physcomitrellae]
MSLKRTLTGLFRSVEGTSDRAKVPELKTRYYQLSKDKLWDEVSSTLKKVPGYKVVHEVPSVGEILLEKRTAFGRVMDITVSLVGTGPTRSAIDIYSATRGSLGDLGANYRNIQGLFSILDKKLSRYKTSA